MREIKLSRQVNEYVPKVRWIASLSNGETIFEDFLPNEEAAWKRLGDYVRLNGLAITKVRVQINELDVDLPSHQEGYIQKKKISSMGANMSRSICIGYVDSGRGILHQLGEDRSSVTTYIEDPGPPWTIYRHDEECLRPCCTKHVVPGYTFNLGDTLYVVKRREGNDVFASRIVDGAASRGKPKRFNISEVVHALAES